MTDEEAYEAEMIERFLSGKDVAESAKAMVLLRRFHDAGWAIPSGRRNRWCMGPDAMAALSRRLDTLWPTRERDRPLLQEARLPLDKASAFLHLPSLRRKLSDVAGFINQHTWSTLFGAGPKKAAWRVPGDHVVLTNDAMSRIRPNEGLHFIQHGAVTRLDEVARSLTEAGIPQRAILAGGRFCGRLPALIVTIENLGAFVDAKVPDSIMLVYSPGFDLRAAEQIVKILPAVPWVHFGDLDAEGLQIWTALKRATGRACQLHIPSFAFDYVDIAQKLEVPWGPIPDHPVFATLKASGRGIFQEAFVLDPRLFGEWSLLLENYIE
jgi:hypothetical protein